MIKYVFYTIVGFLFSSIQNGDSAKVEEMTADDSAVVAGVDATDEGADKEARPLGRRDDRIELPRYERFVAEQILLRVPYTASYNKETRNPNWVAWHLTAEHADGEWKRVGKYLEDEEVPYPRALYSDIRESESGYQRGHMCPAGDCKWAREAQVHAALMTNICPQAGELNGGAWRRLEESCRRWAVKYGDLYMAAGPIFYTTDYKTIGENEVAVPDAFFKVILRLNDNPQALGFIYPNRNCPGQRSNYVVTVDEVEKLTGIDFYFNLPDDVEEDVESRVDLKSW